MLFTRKKNSLKFSSRELTQKDKTFIWHPFTQMKDWIAEDNLIIQRAEGLYLEDTCGKRYLDGVSSLWCNVHGHQVPEIDEAVKSQLSKVAHSTFLGLSNVPAILLAEKLIHISPKGLQRVFYSDSGSEAVEIALKIAYQYWQHLKKNKKQKFLKLTNAYHGDTVGSVSVGGIDLFHEIYQPLLFPTFSAPSPFVYRWPGNLSREEVKKQALTAMKQVLENHHEEIAAIIMEPLMQGAAGMIDQPQGFITEVRKLADKYDVLLIFDEVATGFGRTGKMFASDLESVSPDILTIAKGLTGGYLPLAATLTTEKIFEAFLGDYSELKTFFHGHTFTANPLGCQAALASLELFEKNSLLESLQSKINYFQDGLKKFLNLPIVGDIRQVGLMIGIELVKNRESKEPFDWKLKAGIRIIRRARDKGVILRPLGNVIVLMPPLAIQKKEIEFLLNTTYASIQEEMEVLLNEA